MQNTDTKKPRIAVLHDSFLYRGGGERLVTLMAKSLGADLISGFFSEGSFDPRELGFEGKMIALGKPVFAKGIRHMILKWRFFWKARILRDYDIVIFSGDCLGAIRHVRSDAKKFYYCHTPPRYLYDFRTRYIATLPLAVRPIFHIAFTFFAYIYEKNLKQFDQIFTNSGNVQKRLLDFTGFDSEIVYPPTDLGRFSSVCHCEECAPGFTKGILEVPLGGSNPEIGNMDCHVDFPQGQENLLAMTGQGYFLSFARLSPPKRVNLIVDAFLDMPEENLVFCYGKNDPMKEEILTKIAGKKNITALESPDDDMLISLIQGATATIYIPVDEDFGMSPVESMACGTPVIGAAEGGLLETVIDGKTGKLIEAMSDEGGVMNLKQIIQNTPKEEWENMKSDCIGQAKRFSLEKFQEKLRYQLDINNS